MIDHMNDLEATAMRLKSLMRRAYTFNKSKEDIIMELDWVVRDLQKAVDKMDREMDEIYKKSA